MAIISIVTLFPFLYLILQSFTADQAIIAGDLSIQAFLDGKLNFDDFSIKTYIYVITRNDFEFLKYYGNTILYTFIGTVLSLFFSSILAYLLTPDLEIPDIGEESTCALPEFDWIKAVGDSKTAFSAIGFYAAKRIFEEKNVPIGLILNAQGGSTIEAWMCDEDLYASGISEDELSQLRGKGTLKKYVEHWQQLTIDWRAKADDNDFKIVRPHRGNT